LREFLGAKAIAIEENLAAQQFALALAKEAIEEAQNSR
jgi:hypothetical protein